MSYVNEEKITKFPLTLTLTIPAGIWVDRKNSEAGYDLPLWYFLAVAREFGKAKFFVHNTTNILV